MQQTQVSVYRTIGPLVNFARNGQLYLILSCQGILKIWMSGNLFSALCHFLDEPAHEKTKNLGFRPRLAQTGLYNHRIRLES